jgi:uncharacterized Fe-S cluster protein YjdI
MDREDKKLSGERKYKNNEITVYWKPSACVHASYCYRELIEVFDPGRRPWVDMSGSTTSRIIEVVNMCPTEALSWNWNDEEKNKQVGSEQLNHISFRRPELINLKDSDPEDDTVSVKILINGPIVIRGNFTFLSDGIKKEINGGLISICRCGASEHQPFCDGKHRKVGYYD